MRLTLRFFALVGALLLAVATSVAAGSRALDSLDAALAHVVDVDMPRFLAITHARRAFRSMTVLERDVILARSAAERSGAEAKMLAFADDFSRNVDRYVSLMPPDDAPRIAALRGVAQRWLARNAEVLAAAAHDQDQALVLSRSHAEDPVSWEKEIGELVKQSETRLDVQVQATHSEARDAQGMLFGVSALAAIVALALGTLIFQAIRRNMAEVVRLNGDLEGLVRERTAALDARERSLRLVLDSIGEGLVLVDGSGMIEGECSRAATAWFGVPPPGMSIAQYLVPGDPGARLGLALAFEQLVEDVFPWEVALAQLPRHLQHGGLTLELDVRQVVGGADARRYLFILRNVTDRLRGEQAEKNAREQQAVVAKLLSDRAGFSHFVTDTEQLIAGIGRERDAAALRRLVHTLKGNAALFGMQSLADSCHALEDAMASSSLPPAAGLQALAQGWQERLSNLEVFMEACPGDVLEVDRGDYLALVCALIDRRAHAEVSSMVEMWTWTPALDVLGRIRAQLESLGRRLGKRLAVRVEDNGIRIPPGYLDELWPTLVHVVRNAVDHGVEPEPERIRCGKPPEGQLRLCARLTEHELILELCDDGPGIDVARIVEKARERGLDISGVERPELLIFEDGISTCDEVTEHSGRGVGLFATRAACQAAGGSIDVDMVVGAGTTIRLRFPRPIVRSDRQALERGKRWTLVPARDVA